MSIQEVNFDGLIGPTHNYAGLSFGNVASTANQHAISNPQAAALQGLEKMRTVMRAGIPQAVLPPQCRPDYRFLRQLGFSGGTEDLIEKAWNHDPRLVAAAYSASSMWTANAATVSPSADCEDGRLHFTPANLISTLHRAIEAEPTFRIFEFLFADKKHFAVHRPLPGYAALADEGAANHTRLCNVSGERGIELFVAGRDALHAETDDPQRFPARQTVQASTSNALNHRVLPERLAFFRQHATAIDAGAFHNDVVAVGHRNVLLYHELAFRNAHTAVSGLKDQFSEIAGESLHCIEIPDAKLSLAEAIRTYLFNSQLLTHADGSISMLCPDDCLESEQALACLAMIVAEDNPIESYECLNLRQSMMNGGGPACLRLRVAMNETEMQSMHQGVLLDEELIIRLIAWVNAHYRDSLLAEDLRDPRLPNEVLAAMRELETILAFPSGLLSN